MPNIYDIAKSAGVSVATVSKVLNGYPDVSEQTRQRIRQIAVELGYMPSATARGLATRRSMTIGVFFRDHVNSGFRHPFFHDVIAAFKDVIGQRGYDLLFFANSNTEELDYDARARNRDVDGLLLLAMPRTDPLLETLSRSDLPVVSVDLDMLGTRASYLCSENVKGAEAAIDHLVECGHREIAFVGDQFATLPGHDRLLGYHQALSRHGLPFRADWVTEGDFTEPGGYQATKKLLQLDHLPTAIFYAGDMMAIGGMIAMAEQGIVPGKDISIIGFDDIDIARYVTPGLTTIRQNKEEMGRLAGLELIDLIEKPERAPRVLMVEVELVVRNSVARIG